MRLDCFIILYIEKMKITKRIERLYSLKEYENVKVIVEATIDVEDPKQWLDELSKLLWEDIKKEKEKIKPTKVETVELDWPFN